jgi:hypothetical protein
MAIAFQIRFPFPNRSDQTVKHVKDKDGVIDIGWTEGLMSDGRPFRMEFWADNEGSMLTVFFSASGCADLSESQMTALILAEGFVTFHEGAEQRIGNMLIDPGGNAMWSANILVCDENQTFVASSLPLFAHPVGVKPNSIFDPATLALTLLAWGPLPGQGVELFINHVPKPAARKKRGPSDRRRV